MQQLAVRAQAGDKQAQLNLGILFEEGNGVPANPKFAEKLYMAAARDTVQRIMVYSPPIGRSGRGVIVALKSGVVELGLSEARDRLMHIKNNSSQD